MDSQASLRRLCLTAIVTAPLGMVACGSDDQPASGGSKSGGGSYGDGGSSRESGAAKLSLTAEEGGGFKFDKDSASAKAGSVTLTMDNPAGNQAPHAVAVEGGGLDESGNTAQPGEKSTLTAELKAGRYTFYCPVGDHRQAGMEGTLTVK